VRELLREAARVEEVENLLKDWKWHNGLDAQGRLLVGVRIATGEEDKKQKRKTKTKNKNEKQKAKNKSNKQTKLQCIFNAILFSHTCVMSLSGGCGSISVACSSVDGLREIEGFEDADPNDERKSADFAKSPRVEFVKSPRPDSSKAWPTENPDDVSDPEPVSGESALLPGLEPIDEPRVSELPSSRLTL
jgi:hypothetical protein